MDLCLRGKSKLWVVALVLSLTFGLAAETASAFIDPPVLVPESPTAGQTVSVSIRHGDCDGFYADPPQITQVGNAIHMVLETTRYDDPLWCNLPIYTGVFAVGSFPAGTYTLHIERFYNTLVPASVYETLANFEFTVRGETPVSLPATGAAGGLLLALGILITVAWRHRAGRDSVCMVFLMAALTIPSLAQAQEPHVFEVLRLSVRGHGRRRTGRWIRVRRRHEHPSQDLGRRWRLSRHAAHA